MTGTAEAMAIVFVSTDDGKTWTPCKPDQVPDWVKEPDVMANLLHGECAQQKNGLAWYRAERIEGGKQ